MGWPQGLREGEREAEGNHGVIWRRKEMTSDTRRLRRSGGFDDEDLPAKFIWER